MLCPRLCWRLQRRPLKPASSVSTYSGEVGGPEGCAQWPAVAARSWGSRGGAQVAALGRPSPGAARCPAPPPAPRLPGPLQDLQQQHAPCQASVPRQPPAAWSPSPAAARLFWCPRQWKRRPRPSVGSAGMGTRSRLIRDLAHPGLGGSHRG